MKKPAARFLIVLIALAGVIAVGYAWVRAEKRSKPPIVRTANIYNADIPPFENIPLDPRLFVLSPEMLAKAPLADVFTSPLGGEWGAFTYDAQPFGEKNGKRGGKHMGEDLNGIGGMDTDYGDPVYAAGRGKVIFSGEPSKDWGKVVVLLHRLPDGRFLQSLYAHLSKINVLYGDLVERGKVIGEVGTADGHYPAHLHFEMMYSIGNEAGLKGYGENTANRIDPETIFSQFPPSEKTLIPDPLPALMEIQRESDWRSMHIRHISADSDKKPAK